MNKPDPKRGAPKRQLTLLDSTSIIVGIIIGAGIYKVTPLIAGSVGGTAGLIAVWVAGGLISLIGAMCYAELATAWPREGGDYVFLTRAYGRRAGFLFAWSEFSIVRPGNVGMMAFVFAEYARELWPLGLGTEDARLDEIAYACGAVIVLTVLNLIGVRSGKWTQNLLTAVKVAGLLAIFGVALFWAPEAAAQTKADAAASSDTNYRLAIILVLFTFGGWNDMSFVAAEVRNPERNIFRALLLGTLAVTAIYVLVNLAFVRLLGGVAGVAGSGAVAADALEGPLGKISGKLMAALVCASCLGAINGMMLTGSRIYYALGQEHRLYAWLGRWSARFDAPLRALLVQLAMTLALIVGFGWYKESGGFDRLLIFTAPVFWAFIFMVSISLFILRYKEPDVPRVQRVPLYPWIPLAFCLSAGFMFDSSFDYALSNGTIDEFWNKPEAWAFGLLALGLVLSFFDPPRKSG